MWGRAALERPPTPGTSAVSPEVDYGGVLADRRSPDREVLDALLRVPDTSFATHDDPSRISQLLAERAEHQDVLARPPDRFRHLRAAERELAYARKQHQEAAWRLDRARHQLAQPGGLSQLRFHNRRQKAKLLERIDGFEDDFVKARDKVTGCEANLAPFQRARIEFLDAEVARLRAALRDRAA